MEQNALEGIVWMPVAVAVAAYLLGCLNGAIAVSRWFYRDDVRTHGSGNAGLTNFYRTYGAKCALVVIAVDMLKAVAAVEIGRVLFALAYGTPLTGKYFAAVFCVLGHMFPVTAQFKGGKGILCSGTLLLCLDWRIALIGWGAFALLFLLTRYVSLGSVAAAVSLPLTTTCVYHDMTLICLSAVISGLVLWGHRENIKRLLRGTENKFRFHSSEMEGEK